MNDLYPEHCVVVSLALTACKQLIDQGHALKLYTWEMGSVGRIIRFCPDIIIDITASFAEKVAAIKPFISQVPDHDQQLHLRYITASARYWGDKIGVHYAEPFSKCSFMVTVPDSISAMPILIIIHDIYLRPAQPFELGTAARIKNKPVQKHRLVFCGVPKGVRTLDLLNHNQAL